MPGHLGLATAIGLALAKPEPVVVLASRGIWSAYEAGEIPGHEIRTYAASLRSLDLIAPHLLANDAALALRRDLQPGPGGPSAPRPRLG